MGETPSRLKPASAAKTVNAAKAVGAAKSAKAAKPGRTSQSPKSATAAKAAKPAKASAPEKPAQPDASSASGSATPYSGLTPDVVLDALASAGWRGDGRLLTLNSYENRVYQVYMDDGPPLVAKFYRPARWTREQIQEEHAFVLDLEARELPVVGPLALPVQPTGGKADTLGEYGGFYFAAFPRRGGRAPELESRDTLKWMGRFIGRIHAVGALQRYRSRPAIDVDSYGEEPYDYLCDSGFVPDELFDAWEGAVSMALDSVLRCYERAGPLASLRLHGDCHGGNVLWTEMNATPEHPDGEPGGGPHFVDFDDSRMGPAIQDLWMLISGDRDAMSRQMSDILTGYRDFHEFDPRELHVLEALRTLRLIHYSAWIARRWDDPAFPAAFPWFNTQRYWQDRILELKEQIALMDEPPLWLP